MSLRRVVLMTIAGAAATALSAGSAAACFGGYGYGCGAGYYGYTWGARGGYGFGQGYGYAFPAPAVSYVAPVVYQPNYVLQPVVLQGPVEYIAPAYPPRLFVNQGPVYSGPNVVNFAPRYYNPGYVETRGYPFVGGYGGGYAPRAYRPRPVYRPYGYRPAPRYAGRVYVNQTPRGWTRRTAPAQWR